MTTKIELKAHLKNTNTRFEYLKSLKLYQFERILYLAYAYVRGIPYRVAEPTARPLVESEGAHWAALILSGILKVAQDCGLSDITPADIREWMDVPETEVRAAKRHRAEERGRQAREARRAAQAAMRAQPEAAAENLQ